MADVDLRRLIPPWKELETPGELSEDEILARLETESRAVADWGGDRVATMLVRFVGDWLLLSYPETPQETINRLNGLLSQFEPPGETESRRFG